MNALRRPAEALRWDPETAYFIPNRAARRSRAANRWLVDAVLATKPVHAAALAALLQGVTA